MQLNQVDLNLFVVFEAIYLERNLTRAAERLCLSQPAVSNALSRLRRTFDDPLFVRAQKSMVPTPVAENIIGRVRDALLLMNSSLTEETTFQPDRANKVFRINMSDLIAAMILPAMEENITRTAPGINIESYYIPRPDLTRELATGAVDFGVDVPLLSDPQLHHVPLLKERYVCMVRKDHPHVGDTITVEDYIRLNHIHVSSRRSGLGHVEIALNALGLHRNIQLRLQHNMVAPLVALRSDLALTAPIGLVKQYNARIIELPFAMPEMELHLYWHKSRNDDQSSRWLRDKIIDISSGSLSPPP